MQSRLETESCIFSKVLLYNFFFFFALALGQWEPSACVHFNLEIAFYMSVDDTRIGCTFQVCLHSSFYFWHLALFSYYITAVSFPAQFFTVFYMPRNHIKKTKSSTHSQCPLKVEVTSPEMKSQLSKWAHLFPNLALLKKDLSGKGSESLSVWWQLSKCKRYYAFGEWSYLAELMVCDHEWQMSIFCAGHYTLTSFGFQSKHDRERWFWGKNQFSLWKE